MTRTPASIVLATALCAVLLPGAAPAAARPAAGPASSGPIVLRIASIAPGRSPWDKALQKVANDWERISQGRVQVRIYPGGIAGAEQDMIRKMRLGSLQGGVFSNMGLAKVDHSVTVLSIPFLFHSPAEFNAVFEKIRPSFEKGIEAQGFEVMFWTLAGWINFFTKTAAVEPDDLKKLKISVTADFPEIEQVWKRMGYNVVATESDLMIQLQSGAVSALYLPPLVAASGQFFALAPHMLAPSLAPLIGGLLLSDKAWASIPAELHQPFIEATIGASEGLYDETMKLEDDALKMMKDNGLVLDVPTPAIMAKWRASAQAAVDQLIGSVFSKDTYDQVAAFIRDYRKAHGQ